MKKMTVKIVLSLWIALAIMAVSAVLTSCNKQAEKLEENLASAEDAGELRSCPGCNNCVNYVHCRFIADGKKLPFGLTTYQSKKNLINQRTAAKGYAAIMPGSDTRYGHIAYVESVNANGTITIAEGDSFTRKCTTRTGKPSDFKIDGYFKP